MSNWNEQYILLYNGKNYTLYQDSYAVPIVSGLFMLFSTCLVVITSICFCVRRNSPYIKVRQPALAIIAHLAYLFMINTIAIRFLIGRWRYPCSLFSMSVSLVSPLVWLPIILRFWRIIIIYRMNVLKNVLYTGIAKATNALTHRGHKRDDDLTDVRRESGSTKLAEKLAEEFNFGSTVSLSIHLTLLDI